MANPRKRVREKEPGFPNSRSYKTLLHRSKGNLYVLREVQRRWL
jgi:hypothetical protein